MPNNDLISRAAAIDAICGCFNIMEAQGVDMTVARTIVISALDNAPAVNAVPVVRCRDCKYSAHPDGMPDGLVKCVVHSWGGCISGDFYCGDAVRRCDKTDGTKTH